MRGVVLPSDFGWSDIGSWKSLYDILPKDNGNNVVNGDVVLRDTKNCFIKGEKRIALSTETSSGKVGFSNYRQNL